MDLRALWRSAFTRRDRRAAAGGRNAIVAEATAGAASPAAARAAAKPIRFEGTDTGWLRVLTADELFALLGAQKVLRALWVQSGLAELVWERDFAPALRNYAEFVQLMPASESHHHAHAGGLLAHTLEMTLAAVTWRKGLFLPKGSTAERIAEERDAWTYVMFYAALLHDIGKPLTDMRVKWRSARQPDPIAWSAIAGSLVELARGRAGAEYQVEFATRAERDYAAHSRTAVTLLRQIAPPSAMAFLAQTPGAMATLVAFLSGQDSASPVAITVRMADQASTKRSLAQGSRSRFASARTIPLIELLMGALKEILRAGRDLPLNRDGAAGWVYDGSLWLLARRTANATRAWLAEHMPEQTVPGEDLNDRLFDAWQEYRCIMPNPQTNGAIWYVTVHGEDAAGESRYEHSFAMLRFPLAKLYETKAEQPPAMLGSITLNAVQKSRGAEGKADDAGAGETGPQRAETDAAESALTNRKERRRNGQESAAATGGGGEPTAGAIPAMQFNKPKAHALRTNASDPSARAEKPAAPAPQETAAAATTAAAIPAAPDDVIQIAGGVDGYEAVAIEGDFLDDGEDARAAAGEHRAPRQVAPRSAASAAAVAAKKHGIQPVVVMPKPAALHPGIRQDDEMSPLAQSFFEWLQQGLAGGDLTFNTKGALVHFTAEGLALVSPRVFQRYAQAQQSGVAGHDWQTVQREVLKLGWHRVHKSEKRGRENIERYEVLGAGEKVVGHLHAVVLTEPSRILQPVHPANLALRLSRVVSKNPVATSEVDT